jgi:glycosyltransferase involved in cell wall biosynthesis
LLALISHQENFGLAAAEALACGVPVIVSRGVNLASKIEESNAGWVTPLDEDSVSRALSAALSNPDELRRRGEAGPGFIARSFAWTEVAANLISLYNSVVDKKREPELKFTGESFA